MRGASIYICCRNCSLRLFDVDELCFYAQVRSVSHLTLKHERAKPLLASSTAVKLVPTRVARRAAAVPFDLLCCGCGIELGHAVRNGPAAELITCLSVKTVHVKDPVDDQRCVLLADVCETRNVSSFYGPKTNALCESEPSSVDSVVRPTLDELSSLNMELLSRDRPRSYQLECFTSILTSSKNSIVYLPTGSGKTLVSALVGAYMRQLNPQKLILFIVDRVPLVYQQGRYIEEQTGLTALMVSGQGSAAGPVSARTIACYDVVVCTIQVMLNWLGRGLVQLSNVCCVIMDEIHHAVKAHPYVSFLETYYQPLYNAQPLQAPLLLGLTASPASGNPLQMRLQLDELCKLCVGEMFTPCFFKTSLQATLKRPDLEFVAVPVARDEQRLASLLKPYWEALKAWIKEDIGLDDPVATSDGMNLIESRLELRQLAHTAQQTRKLQASRAIAHLHKLLSAFEMSSILGTKYTGMYLRELLSQEAFGDDALATIRGGILEQAAGFDGTSPKAEALHALLSEVDATLPDSRVLVFVQTKRTARWLCDWLRQRDRQLADRWNPSPFVGQAGTGGIDGMRWTEEQKPLLALFRTGHIRLLVATSVLQEGLDVAACNQVVLFDRTWSLTGFVQSRGRARAARSRYTVIAQASEKTFYERLVNEEAVAHRMVVDRMSEWGGELYSLSKVTRMLSLNHALLNSVPVAAGPFGLFGGGFESDDEDKDENDEAAATRPSNSLDTELIDNGLRQVSIAVYHAPMPHNTDIAIKALRQASVTAASSDLSIFGEDGMLTVSGLVFENRFTDHSWARLHSDILSPLLTRFTSGFVSLSPFPSLLKARKTSSHLQLQLSALDIGSLRFSGNDLAFNSASAGVNAQPTLRFDTASHQLAVYFVEGAICYRLEVFVGSVDRCVLVSGASDLAIYIPLSSPPLLACATVLPQADLRTIIAGSESSLKWERAAAADFGPLKDALLHGSVLKLAALANSSLASQLVSRLVESGLKRGVHVIFGNVVTGESTSPSSWFSELEGLLAVSGLDPEAVYRMQCVVSGSRSSLLTRAGPALLAELMIAAEQKFPGTWMRPFESLMASCPFTEPLEHLRESIKGLDPSTSPIAATANIFLVKRAVWTPARGLVLMSPLPIVGNRLLREFGSERFIRLQIRDDDGQKLGQGSAEANLDFQKSLRLILEHVHVLIAKGFSLGIGQRRFVLLASSASQLRRHGCWLFEERPGEDDLTADKIRAWMGDFSKIRNVAKYVARLGQSLSATRDVLELPRERCKLVDDYSIVDATSGCEYVFSDGCGRIGNALARDISKALNLAIVPSAFQIRYAGCKGVVAVSTVSSDDPDCMYIRPSMLKFESSHTRLEVLNYTTPIPCYLNKQIIMILSALGVPDKVFDVLLSEQLGELSKSLLEPAGLSAAALFNTPERKATLSCLKWRSDPFLRLLRQAHYSRQVDELLTRTRIFVPQGRILMGIVDETGTLAADEVFVQITSESGALQVINCSVVVAKNPCMQPGDVRVLRAVANAQLEPVLFDCIVFPRSGSRPIPDMCSGSDLDGDLYFVSWDVRLAPPETEQPAVYQSTSSSSSSLERPVSIADVHRFLVTYIENDQLGAIANAHVAFADQLPGGVREELCCKLATLFGRAVDFPKTGFLPTLPSAAKPLRVPDFMLAGREGANCSASTKKLQVYPSQKILGRLYRRIRMVTGGKLGRGNPILLDASMLAENYQRHVPEARRQYAAYCVQLNRLMLAFGKSEESQLFWLASSENEDSGNRLLAFSVERLLDDFRARIVNVPAEERPAIASAWYHVAYTEPIRIPATSSHVLSFPWLAIEHFSIPAHTLGKERGLDALYRGLDEQAKEHFAASEDANTFVSMTVANFLNAVDWISKIDGVIRQAHGKNVILRLYCTPLLLDPYCREFKVFLSDCDFSLATLLPPLSLCMPAVKVESQGDENTLRLVQLNEDGSTAFAVTISCTTPSFYDFESLSDYMTAAICVQWSKFLPRAIQDPDAILSAIFKLGSSTGALCQTSTLANVPVFIDSWRQLLATNCTGFGKRLLDGLRVLSKEAESEALRDCACAAVHRLALCGELEGILSPNRNAHDASAVKINEPMLLPRLLRPRQRKHEGQKDAGSVFVAGASFIVFEKSASETDQLRFEPYSARRWQAQLSTALCFRPVLQNASSDSTDFAFMEFWMRAHKQFRLLRKFGIDSCEDQLVRVSLKFGVLHLTGLPSMWAEEMSLDDSGLSKRKATIGLLRVAVEKENDAQYRCSLLLPREPSSTALRLSFLPKTDDSESASKDTGNRSVSRALQSLDEVLEKGPDAAASSNDGPASKRKKPNAAPMRLIFESQVTQDASFGSALSALELVEEPSVYLVSMNTWDAASGSNIDFQMIFDDNLNPVKAFERPLRWLVIDCCSSKPGEEGSDCRFSVTTAKIIPLPALAGFSVLERSADGGIQVREQFRANESIYVRHISARKYRCRADSGSPSYIPPSLRDSLQFALSRITEYALPNPDTGVFGLNSSKLEFEIALTSSNHNDLLSADWRRKLPNDSWRETLIRTFWQLRNIL